MQIYDKNHILKKKYLYLTNYYAHEITKKKKL